MGIHLLLVLLIMLTLAAGCNSGTQGSTPGTEGQTFDVINLPEASRKGTVSIEEALSQRRSVREYAGSPLTLAEVSQLL